MLRNKNPIRARSQLGLILTRESTRRAHVSPPRQSYSPGGVTIFALPAVFLCPF